MSADLSYAHSRAHTRKAPPRRTERGKRMADGSVWHDYCTHHLQISHPPPIHFPFSCSGGRQLIFVKVKADQPTPNYTTEQFFHFLRTATRSLLSLRFPHLEAMQKQKAWRNVRKIWLINAKPLLQLQHYLLLVRFRCCFGSSTENPGFSLCSSHPV